MVAFTRDNSGVVVRISRDGTATLLVNGAPVPASSIMADLGRGGQSEVTVSIPSRFVTFLHKEDADAAL